MMMKFNIYWVILLFSFQPLLCQFNQAAYDSINKISQADHQKMMDLLGISAIRPGVDRKHLEPQSRMVKLLSVSTREAIHPGLTGPFS
jgi:hypothetical protein